MEVVYVLGNMAVWSKPKMTAKQKKDDCAHSVNFYRLI